MKEEIYSDALLLYEVSLVVVVDSTEMYSAEEDKKKMNDKK